LTEVLFIIGAVSWAAIFFCAAVQAVRDEPVFTFGLFSNGMDRVIPTRVFGRWVIAPQSSGARDKLPRSDFLRAQSKRAAFLKFLVTGVVVSGAVAWLLGSPYLEINVVADASLAIYLFLLLQAKRRRAEVKAKVRHIETRLPRTQPRFTYQERRQASAGGRRA
jgi:hypothetical protein